MDLTRLVALASAMLLLAVLPGAALTPAVQGTQGSGELSEDLQDRTAEMDPRDRVHVIVETDGPPGPVADRARDDVDEIEWTYDLIDAFSAWTTVDQLDQLTAVEGVERVWESAPVETQLDNSAADIGAPQAWNESITGNNVSIAVLDTGIEITDPAFEGAISACVATMAGLTVPECDDTAGHGTHVAGIAASRDDTYTGIAHGADLAVVRVLHAAGVGNIADVIAGMEWVAENKDTTDPPIRVATLSVGRQDPGCGDGSAPEAEAADALVAAGVNVTVAAGNAGHEECTVEGLPAAHDVVTVGAVDDQNTKDPADDTLANFSSAGPTEDNRTKPEILAPGVAIWSVFLGPTIANLDGTSMAAPHVAATVAMLAENEPGMTPAEVKDRLISTTQAPDAAPELPDEDWGYGLVDVPAALGLSSNNTTSSSSEPGSGDQGTDEQGPPDDRGQTGEERSEDRQEDRQGDQEEREAARDEQRDQADDASTSQTTIATACDTESSLLGLTAGMTCWTSA